MFCGVALRSCNIALRSCSMALRSCNVALRSCSIALRSCSVALRSSRVARREICFEAARSFCTAYCCVVQRSRPMCRRTCRATTCRSSTMTPTTPRSGRRPTTRHVLSSTGESVRAMTSDAHTWHRHFNGNTHLYKIGLHTSTLLCQKNDVM